MPNNLAHFAVHADDLERAQRFYGSVFGWQFQGFGGTDVSSFCKIKNSTGEDPGVIGAMQSRRYSVLAHPVLGFECSIEVDDVDAISKAVETSGGKILMPKTAVPGVGWLIKFADTEGNLVCAISFDASAK
jgi:predicted enzyme related to lactoylglutathione lyase